MPCMEALIWTYFGDVQWGIQMQKSSTKPSRISTSMSKCLVCPCMRKKTPESLCRRQRMEIRHQGLRIPGLQQQQPFSLPILSLPRGLKKKSSLNTKPPGATHGEFSEGTVGGGCFHCVQRGRTSGASFWNKEDDTKKTKSVHFVMILSCVYCLQKNEETSISFLRKPCLRKEKVWTSCGGAEQ